MFMNLGGPEIGIRCSLVELIALAKRSGFAGVDVDINQAVALVSERGADYVGSLFADARMRIGSWIWFDDFGFEQDEAAFVQNLGKLPGLAMVAEAIGATRVLSWVLPYSDELSFAENFQQHVSRMRAATEILAGYGQSMAVEFVAPRTFREGHAHEFIWNLAGMLELLRAVGAPNLGVLMDSWHWYTSNGTMQDLKALDPSMVGYVHISDAPPDIPIDKQIDSVRRLPGSTGVIPNVEFLKALHDMGYDGPVTAEPFSEEVMALPAEEAARATAEAMRKLCEQAGLLTAK